MLSIFLGLGLVTASLATSALIRDVPSLEQQLNLQLSNSATVILPQSPLFDNVTSRWSDFSLGGYAIVVEPSTVEDVATAVRLANDNEMPFLVTTAGHGTTSSLRNIQNGVVIKMTNFETVEVAADGQSALIGGGADNSQVVSALWAYGEKVTTTLICGCPSFAGPSLGGGFGKYQGYLGLLTDNIISVEAVLANGTIANISEASYPDLFWALRGAGQNYAIVTHVQQRIYDNPVPSWFYAELQFTGDKLEAWTQALNNINANGTQPPEMALIYNLFWVNPAISTTDPVILSQFTFAGTEEEAQPFLTQLTDLGYATIKTNKTLNPTQIAAAAGQDVDGPVCQRGMSKRLNPVGLYTWNATANRAVYETFKELVNTHTQFNFSTVQLEDYSLTQVRQFSPDDSAYPHRDDNFLASFEPIYPTSDENNVIAQQYADEIRRLFQEGSLGKLPTAYLNYAAGDESAEMVYGYEQWRLDRLTALKERYDPTNRFQFYNPIVKP